VKKLAVLFFATLSIVAYGQTATIDTTFTLAGKMKTITYKTNGKKDKVVTYYEGKITSEQLYKNGVREGITTFYNYQKKGKIGSRTSYKNGKLEGLSESYNDTEKVILTGNYQNGLKTGTWTTYENDGITLRYIYNYKDGKYDGKVIDYYKSGKPDIEYFYSNNAKDWNFTYYYENGNKQYTGAYKNEKMFGERLCYTEDGKLANGYFTQYGEDGLLIRECTCVNGKPEGESKTYASGQFSYSVNFKDGKPDGIAVYDKGKRKELYKNGVFVKEIKEETNSNTKP